MMSSLIPEKPLSLFPSLAATIGLEPALLLSLLDDLTRHHSGHVSKGYTWYELNQQDLGQHLPFWDPLDIQRVSEQLRDLGVILLLSAPYAQGQQLKFAYNQSAAATTPQQPAPIATQQTPAQAPTRVQRSSDGATLMPPHWQADSETLAALRQLNIPEHFSREQLPEFVHYWRERGESQRSWGAKFIHHVQRRWAHHAAKVSRATTLTHDWLPSEALQQQFKQEGIPATFVQKSLQRFCLYHKNSGVKQINWDMSFFSWLKEDWEKNDTPFIDKKKSTAMCAEWKPDQHTITYLHVSQGVNRNFIDECIPEFIHKWIEKKAIYSEWGTIFAEHIIQQWRFVQAGVERNPHPKLISPQWQPSADCMEVLQVQSGITAVFINEQIAEFILYWSNRGQAMHSWDNIFLSHVKKLWKKHNEKEQPTSGSSRTKDRSIAQQLNDTSWAS